MQTIIKDKFLVIFEFVCVYSGINQPSVESWFSVGDWPATVCALLLSLIIPNQSDFLIIQHHRGNRWTINLQPKPIENSLLTREATVDFLYFCSLFLTYFCEVNITNTQITSEYPVITMSLLCININCFLLVPPPYQHPTTQNTDQIRSSLELEGGNLSQLVTGTELTDTEEVDLIISHGKLLGYRLY